mmetsp:Transcript_23968/g.45096  ORF Transcript_23968/g.45096 Transcript_23968/m.45096 type:complete len:206 (-) Transcript_23968:147-764(-)
MSDEDVGVDGRVVRHVRSEGEVSGKGSVLLPINPKPITTLTPVQKHIGILRHILAVRTNRALPAGHVEIKRLRKYYIKIYRSAKGPGDGVRRALLRELGDVVAVRVQDGVRDEARERVTLLRRHHATGGLEGFLHVADRLLRSEVLVAGPIPGPHGFETCEGEVEHKRPKYRTHHGGSGRIFGCRSRGNVCWSGGHLKLNRASSF